MVCFDFDGTITSRDSFLQILIDAVGWKNAFTNIVRELPSLLLASAGVRDEGKAKERLFGRTFRGWTEDMFLRLCEHSASRHKHILRPKMIQKLQDCVTNGTKVVVVTASCDLWVKAYLTDLPEVEVIGTKIEIYNGQLTGCFASPNCNGMEKVRRLLEVYPDRKSYNLVVYGNSKGDKEMLDFADEGHLV